MTGNRKKFLLKSIIVLLVLLTVLKTGYNKFSESVQSSEFLWEDLNVFESLESGALNRDYLIKELNYVKGVLSYNQLMYKAHYKIGVINSALYILGEEGDTFEQAVKHLELASFLNREDKKIKFGTLLAYTGLWKYLEPKEKEFCKTLAREVVRDISEENFRFLFRYWGKYVKDPLYFNGIMSRRGSFYRYIADNILKYCNCLEERAVFYSNYEIFFMQKAVEKYFGTDSNSCSSESLRRNFRNYVKEIPGYYKLAGNSNFRVKDYRDLLNSSALRLTEKSLLLVSDNEQKDSWKLIAEDFDLFAESGVLNDIGDEVKKIFSSYKKSNLSNPYFVYCMSLTDFSLNSFDTGIRRMREYLAAASYQTDIERKILNLLFDTYVQARLYIKAEVLLKDAEGSGWSSKSLMWRKRKIDFLLKNRGREFGGDLFSDNVIELRSNGLKREMFFEESACIKLKLPAAGFLKSDLFKGVRISVNSVVLKEFYISEINNMKKIDLGTAFAWTNADICVEVF